MTGRIRVLVAEDHPVMAYGLGVTLRAAAEVEVIGVVGTAAEAEDLAARERPDVVLLDFHLPDRTGAETAATIRRRVPSTTIVVLSADDSAETMAEAIAAGASGYLVKTEPGEGIVDAVRRAAAGEMLVPAETLAALLAQQRARLAGRAERERVRQTLTAREIEVLALMARGLDNAAIADELTIAVNTVRAHTQRILEKLEAHSKLEAVVKAGELDLLPG